MYDSLAPTVRVLVLDLLSSVTQSDTIVTGGRRWSLNYAIQLYFCFKCYNTWRGLRFSQFQGIILNWTSVSQTACIIWEVEGNEFISD